MYAYWYEDGQLMSYVGTKELFSMYKEGNRYYTYREFKTLPFDWFETVVVNGCNQVFNIFAEDVPTEIRALHLLLVKE